MKINNLHYIDSLRGIAIILVLIVHSGLILEAAHIEIPENMRVLMGFGQFGVILFFLVSAYTLFRSLDMRKEKNILYFFMRRFFRIAPLYYIVLLISFFTTDGIAYYRDASIAGITLANLLLHMVFLNGFFSNTYNSILGVEWTIFVEIWFYLLLPIIYLYRRILGKIFIFYILGAGIIFALALYLGASGLVYNTIFKSPIIQFLPFFIGCFIYLHEDNVMMNVFFKKYRFSILGIIAGALLLLSYREVPLLFIIMTLILSCFFLVAKNTNMGIFNNIFLQFIGKISFSLYLIHLTIFTLCIDRYGSIFPHDYTIIGVLVLVIGVVILLSSVTYYLIEAPCIRIGQKIISMHN